MKGITFIILLIFVSITTFGQKQWTKNDGVNIATSSENIPAFPDKLSGFRSAEKNKDYWDETFSWKGTLRIFEGNGWTEIPNFPHTMNHCSDGVFMVRWRSANSDVRISFTKGYSKNNVSTAETGQFGYIYGSNCEQPMFKFNGILNNNESTLGDIYYEIKFWQASP